MKVYLSVSKRTSFSHKKSIKDKLASFGPKIFEWEDIGRRDPKSKEVFTKWDSDIIVICSRSPTEILVLSKGQYSEIKFGIDNNIPVYIVHQNEGVNGNDGTFYIAPIIYIPVICNPDDWSDKYSYLQNSKLNWKNTDIGLELVFKSNDRDEGGDSEPKLMFKGGYYSESISSDTIPSEKEQDNRLLLLSKINYL